MKKGYVIFALVLVLVAMSFAQQKTIVTVGGSVWNAEYSWEDADGNKLGDIGTGNSVGPYISINHGKVNFGASLLFGSFPVNELGLGETEADATTDINMSRGDLNFTIGYRIHRNINLFVGAKSLNWKIEGSVNTSYYEEIITGYDYFGNPIYDYQLVDGQFDAEINEGGMLYGLGISAVIPFGSSGWYGFGSLAGMGGTLTNEVKISADMYGFSETTEEDVTAALAAINVGIGYRFAGGLGLNVGYRADLFNETTKATDGAEEENPSIRVQGAILTLSYSF